MICILHCVHTIPSQVISHHHIFGPLYPLLLLPSSNHHTIVHAHEFQFYVPYMNEIFWFLAFSYLFHLAQYSQGPSILLQMTVFHLFLLPSSIP